MRVRVPLPVLPRLSRPLGNERGATIVLVAIAMTALLSICALAIDIGMLFNSRSEAQRAADAGALAGASSLITESDDAARAREWAIETAEHNVVGGSVPDVQETDVDVDLANGRVTVRVLRTADRGSAMGTWFARIFGIDEVDISADATAEVAPTGRAVCVKPFGIMDRFEDVDEDGVYTEGVDVYDPLTTGYLSDFADGDGFENDFGRPIVIKGGGPGAAGGGGPGGGGPGGGGPGGGGPGGGGPGGGGSGPADCCPGTGPSWYQAWEIPQPGGGFCPGGPGGQGAKCYEESIKQCNPSPVDIGTTYSTANGAMTGPTEKGVEFLIAQDAGAQWNGETITGSGWDPVWEGSPRYGIVPVFHPAREFSPGNQPIEFTNFIGIFFESVEGNGTNQRVFGRIMPARGLLSGEVPASPVVQGVRLVE